MKQHHHNIAVVAIVTLVAFVVLSQFSGTTGQGMRLPSSQQQMVTVPKTGGEYSFPSPPSVNCIDNLNPDVPLLEAWDSKYLWSHPIISDGMYFYFMQYKADQQQFVFEKRDASGSVLSSKIIPNTAVPNNVKLRYAFDGKNIAYIWQETYHHNPTNRNDQEYLLKMNVLDVAGNKQWAVDLILDRKTGSMEFEDADLLIGTDEYYPLWKSREGTRHSYNIKKIGKDGRAIGEVNNFLNIEGSAGVHALDATITNMRALKYVYQANGMLFAGTFDLTAFRGTAPLPITIIESNTEKSYTLMPENVPDLAYDPTTNRFAIISAYWWQSASGVYGGMDNYLAMFDMDFNKITQGVYIYDNMEGWSGATISAFNGKYAVAHTTYADNKFGDVYLEVFTANGAREKGPVKISDQNPNGGLNIPQMAFLNTGQVGLSWIGLQQSFVHYFSSTTNCMD